MGNNPSLALEEMVEELGNDVARMHMEIRLNTYWGLAAILEHRPRLEVKKLVV